MQKIKCLLFDLDDTLVLSDPVRVRALRLSGHPNPESLALKEIRYKSPPALMKPHGGIDMKEYWKNYIIAAKGCIQLTSRKLPSVLYRLQSSGVKLGLVTSSPEGIARQILEIIELIKYFDACIIGYGICGKSKAKGIGIAVKKLCSNAEESAYIGDSIKDCSASSNAGVIFYLASWGQQILDGEIKKNASKIINNVEDLLML
jgi:phosphoglycolate phosphatase-like HAD superfamily hydrolase